MKKDLTIGGIGARSTSVRRRIMKRVCRENVNGVKTNLVMSDIADVISFYTPSVPSVEVKFGFLKTTSTIIREGQTLSLSDLSVLIVNTGQSLTNNGSITINNSQIRIDNITYSPPSPPVEGTIRGGILINNGNLILLSSDSTIQVTGTLTNNVSLTNTGQIYVRNGGIFTNIGSITNTGTIDIANGSGTCGIGTFTAGSYIGTTGTDCPPI